ncbi:hypothetical protein [Nocardioides sp.]|uniref:hypothetical protein n=1 Tax=Nocardioides sp. TaxID=35761 RepID=UPI00356AFA90
MTNTEPMRFDAPTFAHAFLAVFNAAGTDKDLTVLYKAVAIERYTHGVRLVATDRFMLLTAWVPDVSDHPEPQVDELPERTVIAADTDGLARHLLGHVISLANRDEFYQPGTLQVHMDFDVRIPPGVGEPETLEGLEPTFVVFDVPDVERVYLPAVGDFAADWRRIVIDHQGEETKQIGLNPEFMERLGKVRKHAEGTMTWRFGGTENPALVDWEDSLPHVMGVVMPRRRLDNDPSEDEATEPGGDGGITVHTLDDLDLKKQAWLSARSRVMTRSTRVAVLTPGIDPEAMWREMATILRAPEHYQFEVKPDGVHAALGQGLDALMDLTHGRGELVPERGCDDYCAPDCPSDWCFEPAHYLMADFDTAYGATDSCGCHSGGIHVRLVSALGDWLDQQGAEWAWHDESGDGWRHDDTWGTLIGHGGACPTHASIPAPKSRLLPASQASGQQVGG